MLIHPQVLPATRWNLVEAMLRNVISIRLVKELRAQVSKGTSGGSDGGDGGKQRTKGRFCLGDQFIFMCLGLSWA